MRLTGSNFTDLALALWREFSQIENEICGDRCFAASPGPWRQAMRKRTGQHGRRAYSLAGRTAKSASHPGFRRRFVAAIFADCPRLPLPQPCRKRPQRVSNGENALFRTGRRRSRTDAVSPGRRRRLSFSDEPGGSQLGQQVTRMGCCLKRASAGVTDDQRALAEPWHPRYLGEPGNGYTVAFMDFRLTHLQGL